MTTPIENALPVLFVASLVLGLLLVPLARVLARRIELVDQPDGRRKMHGQAIPVAGGLAVFAAVVLTLGLTAIVPGSASATLLADSGGVLGLFLGATVICAVGVVDDYRRLAGRYKLIGQILAASLVIIFGVQIREIHLFGWYLSLGSMSIPFTLFWLLGAINSLNLIDGMDGLLGTIGTIVCLTIAVLAAMNGHTADAFVAVTFAGALVGFLRYNLPPASIFLGDAGSMLVGLAIGTLAIRCSLKGPATVTLAAPIALLILPIFDTAAAVVRRKMTGRSIYSTDRGHLHHCLLRSGLSRFRVLILVSALCAISVVGALASIAYQNEGLALLSAAVVVVILVTTRLFGHRELSLIIKSCLSRTSSLFGKRREIEVRLQGTAGWGVLWTRLTDCADRLNFHSIALDVNAPAFHEGYHARWHRPDLKLGEDSYIWSVTLPLTACGQSVGRVVVTGHPDGEAVWYKLAALAQVTDQADAILAAPANVNPQQLVPAVSG